MDRGEQDGAVGEGDAEKECDDRLGHFKGLESWVINTVSLCLGDDWCGDEQHYYYEFNADTIP